jgi:glycerol kinase
MRVLAIDQGTSATKALVVEPDGSVSATAGVEISPTTLPGGGVEQDPEASGLPLTTATSR